MICKYCKKNIMEQEANGVAIAVIIKAMIEKEKRGGTKNIMNPTPLKKTKKHLKNGKNIERNIIKNIKNIIGRKTRNIMKNIKTI